MAYLQLGLFADFWHVWGNMTSKDNLLVPDIFCSQCACIAPNLEVLDLFSLASLFSPVNKYVLMLTSDQHFKKPFLDDLL